MSLKDIFSKNPEQVLSSQQLENLYEEVESEGLVEQIVEDNNRYLPSINFETASNFARYGLAEKYYADGIRNIYENYPYDGSKKEKQEWRNRSSQLDLYIFDNIYPRTTGYVTLSGSNASVISNVVSSSQHSYIKFNGNLKTPDSSSYLSIFKTANKYDINTNREYNLAFNPNNYGNTVEFWLKIDKQSYENLNNSNIISTIFETTNNLVNNSFNQFSIDLDVALSNPKPFSFKVSYLSGSSGISSEDISVNSSIDFDNWNHFAFILQNQSSDLSLELYVNGVLDNKKTFSGQSVGYQNYNLDMSGSIGARCHYLHEGKGGFFGSIDEFRFWKEARTQQEIYRNWFTQVGGGSNTDDSNTELGIYFKFNEGIHSEDVENYKKLNSKVLDYSGRISNGVFNSYLFTRSTSSAIEEFFSNSKKEFKDPIIFSTNNLVQQVLKEMSFKGYLWDKDNTTNFINLIPSWITQEAEEKGLEDLNNLVQIMSSYFDTLHLQIEHLPKIKQIEYTSKNNKPKPFMENILRSFGFENINIFNDTTFIEEILSRNENTEFNDKIINIKNYIYENIYNNLISIYKSKGTEKSIRNLMRCFGIEDELLKINTYANNVTYDLKDSVQYSSYTKKFADFNDPDRNKSVIYQKNDPSDTQNTLSFITGSGNNLFNFIPITLQTEVIFPKMVKYDDPLSSKPDFKEISIFGIHTANNDPSILTWGNDEFNFDVYAVKRNETSPDVYFKLVSNGFGSNFTLKNNKFFKNVYENSKWNFSVRIKPIDNDVNSELSNSDYILEFTGYSYVLDIPQEEFKLQQILPRSATQIALNKNKRVYIGARYQDFDTNNVATKCDVKISSVRYWLDYLTDEELKSHASNASSKGRIYPTRIAYPQLNNSSLTSLIKSQTLLFNWDFSNVTSSDGSGNFFVNDVSSGSFKDSGEYTLGDLSGILSIKYPGYGTEFIPNDINTVNKEYIFTSKFRNPESLASSDMISVPITDDINYTKNTTPISYYFSIEKSMYQIINDEIINWFSTMKTFNNFIGAPIERYNKEYKQLSFLRKLFFKNVQNTPNFEKFIEFYKWVDVSITNMISQMLPSSAAITSEVRNIIESHMLERNKYQNKLPLLNFRQPPVASTINLRSVSYLDIFAPYNPTGSLWLKTRADRTSDAPGITSGDPIVDENREQIRKIINYKNNIELPTFYDNKSNSLYEGKKDFIRMFSNVAETDAEKLQNPEKIINPLNITNTKIINKLTSSLSDDDYNLNIKLLNKNKNFANTYEYVQTNGRTDNNHWFANNSSTAQASSSMAFSTEKSIGGVLSGSVSYIDFPKQIRNIRKTVFVNKFSAPGDKNTSGKYLEPTGEEYSVYNELNNRNLLVRNTYKKLLAATSSINEPSVHRVTKNTNYLPYKNQYDNAYISHQIPRSDSQYTWITASLTKKPNYSGYFGGYDNLNIYNSDSLSFFSGSSYASVLDTNLNSINIQKIYDTGSNLTSVNTSSLGSNLNIYLTNLNGPYQHPSWKQIRLSNNKFSQILRKANKIVVQESPKEKFRKNKNNFYENYIEKRSSQFKTYKEPPIEYNSPIIHHVSYKDKEGVIKLYSSYDNMKNKFANEDLSSDLGVKEREELQAHDILMRLQKENIYEPKPKIEKIFYKSLIYPPKNNIGLANIRTKLNYEDDINNTKSVINLNTFWRDVLENRKRNDEVNDIYNFNTRIYSNIKDMDDLNIYQGMAYPGAASHPEFSKDFGIISGNVTRDSIFSLDKDLEYSSTKFSSLDISKKTMLLYTELDINNTGSLYYGLDGVPGYFANRPVNTIFNDLHDNSCCVIATLSTSQGIYIGGNFEAYTKTGTYFRHLALWNGTELINPLDNKIYRESTDFGLSFYQYGAPEPRTPWLIKYGSVHALISASDGIWVGGDFKDLLFSQPYPGVPGYYYATYAFANLFRITSNSIDSFNGYYGGFSGTIRRLFNGPSPIIHKFMSASEGMYIGGRFNKIYENWSNNESHGMLLYRGIGNAASVPAAIAASGLAGATPTNASYDGGFPWRNCFDRLEINKDSGQTATIFDMYSSSYGINVFGYFHSGQTWNTSLTSKTTKDGIYGYLAWNPSGSNALLPFSGSKYVIYDITNKTEFVETAMGETYYANPSTPPPAIYSAVSGADGFYFAGNYKNTFTKLTSGIADPRNVSTLSIALTGSNVNTSGWLGNSSVARPLGNPWIRTLASASNGIYIGGEFTNAAQNAYRIARWKDNAFYTLYDGTNYGLDQTVIDIKVNNSNKISIGGLFRGPGQATINKNVLVYTKNTKGELAHTSIFEKKNNIINSIFYQFINVATYNTDKKNIYNINGNINSDDSFFEQETVRYCLPINSNKIYFGGDFNSKGYYITQWDSNSGYSPIPANVNLKNVVTCIASGSDLFVNQLNENGIFRYSPSAWFWDQKSEKYDGTDLGGTVQSFVSASDGVYGIGLFTIAGPKTNNTPNSVAVFDGTVWNTTTGSGQCIINSDSFPMQIISESSGIYIAHDKGVFSYNSNSLGMVELKDNTYSLRNTYCLASSSIGLFVGGSTGLSQDGGKPNSDAILRWDGTAWHSVVYSYGAITDANFAIRTLKVVDDYLYFGGDFSYGYNGPNQTNKIYLNNIGKIKLSSMNNTTPSEIEYVGSPSIRNGFSSKKGAGVDSVWSLANLGNILYVAGHFYGTRSGPIITDIKYKFPIEVYSFSDNLLTPSPKLLFNNFIPPSIGNTSLYSGYIGKSGMKIYENTGSSQNIYNNYEYMFTINEGSKYETDKKSGKKPFFDSYEEFSKDLKPMSKKHGYVPEFNISNYIKSYIKEKNGNFNSSLNIDYLEIKGINESQDFQDINNSFNVSNTINEEIIKNYDADKLAINVKVSAIKKLLPKRDFYPHERINTLGNYFINSILDNNSYTSSIDTTETYLYALSNGSPVDAQILTLMQPMFSPGILMNTIKSSLAVDYPVMIANDAKYDSTTPPSFYGSYASGYSLIKDTVIDQTSGERIFYTGSMFINKDYTFRFPFESILDPDLYIPNTLKKQDISLYYLDPTYYTTDILSGSEYKSLAYPCYAMKAGPGTQGGMTFKDYNYKLAMHNFLAEIPKFFLKNGQLTSFKSKPEYQFKSAVAGKSYYMDVIIEKSDKYDSFITHPFLESLKKDINNFYNATYLTPSPDSLYGPPSRFWNERLVPLYNFGHIVSNGEYCISPYNLFSKLIDSPAYAPYVPPYFYGKSIARIKFTPKISGMYALNEIFAEATVEYLTPEADILFADRAKVLHFRNGYSRVESEPIMAEGSTWDDVLQSDAAVRAKEDAKIYESPAYKNMMRISSSVNLFSRTELKEVNFKTDTLTPENVYDSSLRNNNVWVIQTKFETPSINFSGVDSNDNIGLQFLKGDRKLDKNAVSGYFSYLFKGIWTTHGEPAKNGEGIQLSLAESYYNKNLQFDNTGSLIDMCGFQVESKTIGLLEENKKVNEAIIMIPYTFQKNHNFENNQIYAETIPEILGENNIYSEPNKGNGPFYFKIDRKILSDLLGVSMQKESLVDFEQIKTIVNSTKVDHNNSIIKLVKSMTKFVIPPHLDWIKNKNIDPFVMYITEFSTRFDKEDLSNIWQGLMPKASENIELEEQNISHNFEKNQLFHAKKIPPDLKFKIFKVKQAANINYYKLTLDNSDDNRFKFSFSNSQETVPDYSYNWPYDFFSFIELINIEVDLNVDDMVKKNNVTNQSDYRKAIDKFVSETAIFSKSLYE